MFPIKLFNFFYYVYALVKRCMKFEKNKVKKLQTLEHVGSILTQTLCVMDKIFNSEPEVTECVTHLTDLIGLVTCSYLDFVK